MSLEDIKKRWEKVEREMPLLVAPTKHEVQQHNDIRKLIAVADAAKEFMHLERPRCRMFPEDVIMDSRIRMNEALDALECDGVEKE